MIYITQGRRGRTVHKNYERQQGLVVEAWESGATLSSSKILALLGQVTQHLCLNLLNCKTRDNISLIGSWDDWESNCTNCFKKHLAHKKSSICVHYHSKWWGKFMLVQLSLARLTFHECVRYLMEGSELDRRLLWGCPQREPPGVQCFPGKMNTVLGCPSQASEISHTQMWSEGALTLENTSANTCHHADPLCSQVCN